MDFSIERPWALYGLLAVIPAILYMFFVYRKTEGEIADFYGTKTNRAVNMAVIKLRLIWRFVFRITAWVMLVLSIAGISWGTVSTPVQKNGHAVSMVFDISYSMTAKDAPSGLTRLEASGEYAKMLLSKIDGAFVSAVIAKGDGVIAVPLTEDRSALVNLLEMLSPTMMTSAGTSLGGGIEAALRSFPRNMSQSPVIWLFTDGDETDGTLLSSINNALRNGISVIVIGFGKERDTEIIAGDGETPVKTALRADRLREIVDSANKKNSVGQGLKFLKNVYAAYVDATEVGSAVTVLSSIRQSKDWTTSRNVLLNEGESFTMSYEIKLVDRHMLFLVLAIIFFALSFFASEFSPKAMKETLAVTLIALSFTSCSTAVKDSRKILEGTWNWHQKKYNKSVALFMQTLTDAELNGDELTKQYALYGLSVTYFMQNEKDASIERMKEITSNAPESIQFAVCYNSGLLAQRDGNYERAVELFKMALEINPSDINAKINLELSQHQDAQGVREAETEMTPASETQMENQSMEKTVFNRMRENEQKQWKSYESQQKNNPVLDY